MRPDILGHFAERLRVLAGRRGAGQFLHALSPSGERPRAPAALPRYRHISDFHELVFVVSGQAQITTPSRVFELRPGVLLVIEAGVDHAEEPAPPSQEYRIFWCGLSGTLARLDETAYRPPGVYEATPQLLLDGHTDVESIAAAISGELHRKDLRWRDSVHSLLRYLHCILLRRLRRTEAPHPRIRESTSISAQPGSWRIIRAALRFCDANFREPVRLSEVAAAVGYSPSYLGRLFSAHVGRCISDYLRDLRIAAAKEMLERSELPVHEIAEAVGYSDHSHFTRAFAHVAGMSPKTYRKRLSGR